jgi:CDP-glycerol glycerophosphotransferase
VLRFVGLFIRVDPYLVLIETVNGDEYGDNPRILFEAMQADPRFNILRYVWAFEHPDQFSIPGAEIVKLHSRRYFFLALKAGVWLANSNMEKSLHYKKRETFYFNLWHGLSTIKMPGNAQKTRKDYDLSSADIFLTCLPDDRDFFVKNFNVKPEAMRMVGRPIDDPLFRPDPQRIRALKSRFRIPDDKKVILYAPTYREEEFIRQTLAPINISKWKNILSDQYVVVFHKHHLSNEWQNIEYDEFFINGNSVDYITDLYLISDILITDYSSCVFSYAILKRPIILFPYDYEEYAKKRGVYFDLKAQFTCPVIQNEDDLIHYLCHLDESKEVLDVDEIHRKYIHTDGHALDFCLAEMKRYLERIDQNVSK